MGRSFFSYHLPFVVLMDVKLLSNVFFFERLPKLIISDTFKSCLEIIFYFLCILWQHGVKGCQRCQGWTRWDPGFEPPLALRSPARCHDHSDPMKFQTYLFFKGMPTWNFKYIQNSKKNFLQTEKSSFVNKYSIYFILTIRCTHVLKIRISLPFPTIR